MQRKSTRRIAIIRSAASTLLTLLIFESQIFAGKLPANSTVARKAAIPGVTAQNDDGVVLLFASIPAGIARGQTLRVSVGNFVRLDGREQNPVEVRAQVRLFDAQGLIVTETAEVPVGRNQFRSINFNRDRLPLPGENRTGRLQVREEMTIRCIGVNRVEAFTIRQKALEFFPASSELVDNASGKSDALDRLLPLTILLQAPLPANQNTVGLASGQTLRLSALNPEAPRGEPIRVRIKLSDARGATIAQSAEVAIPAGEFHSIDFTREDLPLSGEPGTGRLQLVWSVEASAPGNSPHLFFISVETVDNSTGATRSRSGYAYLAMPLNQG